MSRGDNGIHVVFYLYRGENGVVEGKGLVTRCACLSSTVKVNIYT